VQQITGVQVRETVPDWVMQRVDEIVLADLTPQALQKRMERGDIYPVDRDPARSLAFLPPGKPDRACASWRCARSPELLIAVSMLFSIRTVHNRRTPCASGSACV
jgi:hypothetical protein